MYQNNTKLGFNKPEPMFDRSFEEARRVYCRLLLIEMMLFCNFTTLRITKVAKLRKHNPLSFLEKFFWGVMGFTGQID